MATCAADLLSTAVHNIEIGDVDPKFQRQLVYPNVSAKAVEKFRKDSAELSANYLQDLNRLLADSQKDAVDQDGAHRVGFGIYYFDSPSIPSQETNPSNEKDDHDED